MQSVTRTSDEISIYMNTLRNWTKVWSLKIELVPASAKDSEAWTATDKFSVLLETLGGMHRKTPTRL